MEAKILKKADKRNKAPGAIFGEAVVLLPAPSRSRPLPAAVAGAGKKLKELPCEASNAEFFNPISVRLGNISYADLFFGPTEDELKNLEKARKAKQEELRLMYQGQGEEE